MHGVLPRRALGVFIGQDRSWAIGLDGRKAKHMDGQIRGSVILTPKWVAPIGMAERADGLPLT